MLSGIHINARTRGVPGEHCTVQDDQCSSSVSDFDVVADWCMHMPSSIELLILM